MGLDRYAQVFADNDVDLDALRLLNDKELQELGVSLGHRKKLLKAVAELADSPTKTESETGKRGNEATEQRRSEAFEPLSQPSAGERRQLTVMFIDLVGSTTLSQQLDPEEYHARVRAYQVACGQIVAQYEGHIAQYLGDGVLVYFGYPQAHEEDAVRAVRSGLEIVTAVNQLPFVPPLQIRIGIHTGSVVVAEIGTGIRTEHLALGETPNLAARVQGQAAPNTVVISGATERLVRGLFDLRSLGAQELKGVTTPLTLYHVVQESAARSRFEATVQAGLTPLVGREHEIALLLERWQLAREDEGQVVVLSGEPGIGKSRIVSALLEQLPTDGVNTLRFQCSPYHVNSAFYPIIDNFERALKFGRDESAESKLDKLEALVVEHYGRPLEDGRFLAAMLSIPCETHYGAISMTPQKHKDETLRSLVDLTETIAGKHPSVVLFEDAHWADPTSLEVLDLLIDRVRTTPLLFVLTHRPEFPSRWSRHDHVTAMNLSKLTRAQSRAIVTKLTNGKALPAELLGQILAKTDGVPLFVEELTKAILESGALTEASEYYEYSGNAHSITVPATLRDSLMARLDRLGAAKEIAQIGAAIGREFSYTRLAAVASMPKSALDDALEQLTDSGLTFRRGNPPEATYTFKHALVQDAAYDSLLKSRRHELHATIAQVLERDFPQTITTRTRAAGASPNGGRARCGGDSVLATSGYASIETRCAERNDYTPEPGNGVDRYAAAVTGAQQARSGAAHSPWYGLDGAQKPRSAGGVDQSPPGARVGQVSQPPRGVPANLLRPMGQCDAPGPRC
ncbi:MAG: AAA family ATPase [Candidatus Binatia bacterium]